MAEAKQRKRMSKVKTAVEPAETPAEEIVVPETPIEATPAEETSSPVDATSLMGNSCDVAIELIDVVPGLNPRIEFDPDSMSELAVAISNQGLLQPVILRPKDGGRFDLMAGERRLRACRDLLQLKTIWAKIVVADDELQAAITDDENRQRVQLNPIEAAKSLEMRLTKSGLNQSEFAKKNGVSQSHVSNTLRLLDLPAAIRDLVISGKIAPAYARTLIPFLDVTGFTPAICENLTVRTAAKSEPLTAAEVNSALIEVCRQFSRPVNGQYWDPVERKAYWLDLSESDLTPGLRMRLDARECPANGASGKELRAFNLFEWVTVHAEREAAREAESAADYAEEDASDEESKRREERLAANAARDYERELHDYVVRWHQGVIAKWLPGLEQSFRLRLMLHFCVAPSDHRCDKDLLTEILQPYKIELGVDSYNEEPELLYTLSQLNKVKLQEVSITLLQRWVQIEVDRWASDGISYDLLAMMAQELGIEIAAQWEPDADFLSFQTLEQLLELTKEWKLKKHPKDDRDKLVAFILDQVGLKAPARLLAVPIVPATQPAKPTETPSAEVPDDSESESE